MSATWTSVITFWNRGAEALYGWEQSEAVGKISHELLQTVFPAPIEEIEETMRQSRPAGRVSFSIRRAMGGRLRGEPLGAPAR